MIEKNPRKDDFSEDETERLISRADVASITGTSMTNHTVPALLRPCGPKTLLLMPGDTVHLSPVPLSPVLFDDGVHALSGAQVVDDDLALRCVSQGATFRQIEGTKRLTMVRS